MPSLSPTQKAAFNNAIPAAKSAGYLLGDALDDIFDALQSGQFGIESDAADIDALALGGGSLAQDSSTTTGTTFGFKAGRVWVDGSGYAAVVAGTVALTPSTTNYVQVNAAGSVSRSTAGFDSSQAPLFIVITSSTAITSVAAAKNLIRVRPATGLPGSVLSAAAATKTIQVALPVTISATGSQLIHAPSTAATLIKAALLVDTTISQDASNYWTWTLTNKQAGSGSVPMLAAVDANTTKTSTGAAVTAYSQRALSINSGSPANLVTSGGDCLLFTSTKAGTAANISNGVLLLDFGFSN